jgi:amino acid adenylation domain-containing protein
MADGLNLALPFYQFAQSQPGTAALRVDAATFTYADLGRHAQGIADWIAEQSSGRAQRIAILGGRSYETYAGLLGTCWSGAAYIPMNPKIPAARLRQMLDTIRPEAVLFDGEGEAVLSDLRGSLACSLLRVAALDPAPGLCEPVPVNPEDPAYILFTSGSTGVPKAAPIAFRGVACYLAAMAQQFPLNPQDRVAQPCDLSFDVSASNIFTAWGSGATLCVVPVTQAMAPRDFIRGEEITCWFSTPTVAVFLDEMKMLRPGIFPSLRYSIFAGDVLPESTANRWQEAAPASSLHNLYGPTEATISCIGIRYRGPETLTPGRAIVAMGRPFENTELRIWDNNGRDIETYQPGELLIGGPQVGLGYWHDPELTEARFPVINGSRWYRTGDLVYRDSNGVYHFLGRVDNQVKVRGYRVELGEIEAHLREVCSSSAVAAVPWPVRLGSATGIVAFVSGTERSPAEIQRVMRDRLPAQSVPNQVRVLDQLPVGLSGKIDRKALTAVLESGN